MHRIVPLALLLMTSLPSLAADALMYIGTYTREGGSRGIYSVRLNLTTGALSEPKLAAEGRNPTFLVLHPNGKTLYAGGELLPPAEKGKGGVTAFSVEPGTEELRFLNQQPTDGGGTTHLAVDATGKTVVAVNYGDGYTCALPLEADGKLGPRSAFFKHSGQLGPNAKRQDKPHAHSVTFSPDNKFALVCDLGLDRVYIFRVGTNPGGLTAHEPPFAIAPAGTGPRHSKFAPDGRFFYVLNELDASVTVFAYDSASGTLTQAQSIAGLPTSFTGQNTAAEIRLHPNGRFVYTSNRGHDSLTVFARDLEKGTLSLVENVPCGGKHPRNFALSDDGNWLVCASRDTDNLVVFRCDAVTGKLTKTGHEAKIPMPVCVLFMPR